MNMTDADRRHLHDLEDQLERMTTRAEKAEAELADASEQIRLVDSRYARSESWARTLEAGAADHVKLIEALQAELAAIKAEAARPIEVGDVVQVVTLSDYFRPGYFPTGTVVHVGMNMGGQPSATLKHQGHGTDPFPQQNLTRIGRAVLMPDGSPVPEIGGGE